MKLKSKAKKHELKILQADVKISETLIGFKY